MSWLKRILVGSLVAIAISIVGCASDTSTPPTQAEPAPTKAAVTAPVSEPITKLLSLSNDSPHLTVVDADTHAILETRDLAEFTKWAWNDDNNYFDGKNVWLGLKYPEPDDAVVIALDLATLEVKSRISVGKEAKNIYIGKATSSGLLHIGKQASGQVVVIDTTTAAVVGTFDMPVNDGVVCDADIGIGPDGIERFYYPTLTGDTVVVADAGTLEVIRIVETPDGAKPVMHTNAPDGRMWVQESGSNTNAVFDPITLDLIKRFPAGKGPVVGTFSPDGTYAYIGHYGDPIVQVVNTATLQEVARITVGTTPTKIAVHPNGKYIYAIASKEASLVVIDTESWKATIRIPVEVNPTGFFLWQE